MYRVLVAVALLFVLTGCGEDEAADADRASSPTTSVTESASEATPGTVEATPAEPTSSAAAIPAGAPACDQVWVDGATLAKDYRGCVTGQGAERAYVRAERVSCSSGQAIVHLDDRFWAVRGGPITQAKDIYATAEYRDAVSRCRG